MLPLVVKVGALVQAMSVFGPVRYPGVVIANLDGGIDSGHAAFTGKLWTGTVDDFKGDGNMTAVHGWDFNSVVSSSDKGDSNIEETSTNHDAGHGTAQAGILVGNQFAAGSPDSGNIEGVASGAEVLTLKISHIDDRGPSYDSVNSLGVKKALQWIHDHYQEFNIVAVNMSFGVYTTVYNDPTTGFVNEIAQLAADKLFLATSAGNTANPTQYFQFPAADPKVVTVGGWNQSNNTVTATTARGDTRESDNNRKPAAYVDILAPGVNVWRAVLSGGYYYGTDEQTSEAAPFVTAAGALLKQVNPGLSTSDILSILTSTGSSVAYDAASGRTYKRIDIDGAIAQAITQSPIGAKGAANDIKYDASGTLHLVWYSTTAKLVLYSKLPSGGAWTAPEVVDAGIAVGTYPASHDVGPYLSMDLESGSPRVAMYDTDLARLRYSARSTSGTWNVAVLDAPTGVHTGVYPSIKVASPSNILISYYNKTNGDLRAAQWNGSTWTLTTVNSSGDVGRHSRNALDPNTGRWVIAYDDTTNSRALYVRQNATGWDATSTAIDDTSNDVAFTDLQFDDYTGTGGARPMLSYYDTANANLKFAYAATGGATLWTSGVVRSTGTQGLYTNLHFRRNTSGLAVWDIIYLNKSNGAYGSVDLAEGVGISYNAGTGAWDGFVNTHLRTDAAGEVRADYNGANLTISYAKDDGSGVVVY